MIKINDDDDDDDVDDDDDSNISTVELETHRDFILLCGFSLVLKQQSLTL